MNRPSAARPGRQSSAQPDKEASQEPVKQPGLRAGRQPHAEASRKPASQNSALSPAEFRQLAEFRYQLLRFLHFSQGAAEAKGLRPQQHQLLLAVQGIPEEMDPSIANVASRLLLKHNSVVELVDRTIEQGFLRRTIDPADQRRILLRLTAEGDRMLRALTEYHLAELEESGPALIRALRRVTRANSPTESAGVPDRGER